MPNKHNDARRQHIPKMKSQVKNWAEYDAGLRRRGTLTLWMTERCITSIFEVMGVSLKVPDHSTLSRRAMDLKSISNGCRLPDGPAHILIDSAGLKFYGAGEWLQEKHKVKARRSWRKLHLAVDAESGTIMAATLTGNDAGDPSQVWRRSLTRSNPKSAVSQRMAPTMAPRPMPPSPHVTAVLSYDAAHCPTQRDQHIALLADNGRIGWQKETDYGKRALAETTMGRYTAIIGPRLHARHLPRQQPKRPSASQCSTECWMPDGQTPSAFPSALPDQFWVGHPSPKQSSMQQRPLNVLMKTILASLFLLFTLISTLAYADENALILEANNALAQKDYLTAFSKLSIVAQHGNADAQYNVGSLYFNGMGVKKDFKQAFEWYHKAALQGKAKAQYILGFMYQNGLGVQQGNKQSIDWYQKAAAQGSESALQAIKREAALGNENAKSALGILQPQPTPAATLPQAALAVALPQAQPQPLAQAHPQSVIDNKKIGLSLDQTNKTPTGENYGQQQSGQSSPSNFSLGVTLGQIGKLTGVSNSSSTGLLAGYKFNSSYGIELAYNSLYRNANASTLASTIYPGATGAFDMNSFSLSGQYTYPLSSDFSLLGNLGLHRSSYNLKSSGNTLKSGSTNGMVAGLKVQYDFGKNIGIRGGFDTYSESGAIKGTLTEIGVSAIFKF